MTEYDYSPDAYERYMENQNRVSNWVHNQANHAPRYGNPFIPRSESTPPADLGRHPSSRHRDYERSDRESSRYSSSSRPHPSRSMTIANPPQQYKHTRSPSRSHEPSRSHSHHKSSSSSTPVMYVPPAPQGYQTAYKTYTIDPRSQREIVLPAPRRGETYVIIPPKGQRVEVVNGSYTSGSRSMSQSPTKKGAPLIRRLFGLGSGSPTDSKSSGLSGHSSHSSSRTGRRERRLSYS
ncbi:hypothetical protein ABKN59_008858 [Abortiporus biennis]